MNKQSVQLISFVILFVLAMVAFGVTLYLYISVISKTPDVVEMEVKQADEKTALVSYLSGEAFVLRGENWIEISIGDVLTEKDRVKVVDNSFCELQFGQMGILAIESNTLVDLSSIYSAAGNGKVDLNVVAGTIMAKVNKLSGTDQFEVRAQSAVIGVRGTHFLVSNQADVVNVAVSEGSIEFFSVDESFDRIVIPPKTEVAFVPSQKAPVIPAPISEENSLALEKVEEAEFLPLDSAELVPVLIQSVPQDAAISVNGILAGYGQVYGVYEPGDVVQVEIMKNGYKSESLSIPVEAGKTHVHEVVLEVDDSVQIKQKTDVAAVPNKSLELEAEIETLKKELAASKSEQDKLLVQQRELEGRINNLNNQVGSLEADKRTLSSEVEAKEQEILRIKEALKTLTGE